MKIVFVANKDITLFLFRREIIESLIEKGYNVFVVCPYGNNIPYFQSIGCTHLNLNIDRRGRNLLRELNTLFQLKKILRKISPSHVFTFTIKPNLYTGLTRYFLKFHFFPTITGLGAIVNYKGLALRMILWLYRLSFSNTKTLFFQNSDNLAWFKANVKAVDNYLLVNGSGVNLSKFVYEVPREVDRTVFLFLGRIMQDKGIEEFLTAAKRIKGTHSSQVDFWIAGYIEELKYEDMIDKHKDIIKYLGFVEDTREIVRRCSVLVLPSYHEGLSNVLLEAQATGRPVIASNIPGCKETFVNGISGISIEPKNAESLIVAMEMFLSFTIETKINMGLAGRKHVEEHFDREKVIQSYIKVIE